jgi:hypothetical protein
MNILIVGDSFSSDWSIKYSEYSGWPNLLAKDYDITNMSQAGCSEYKILKQLQLVDLQQYDFVVISHTSPGRIYTPMHPVHSTDPLHKNSDLIYTDIEYHNSRLKNIFNISLKTACKFFLYHYDDEYYDYVYKLIRNEITSLTKNCPTLIVNHLPCLADYTGDNILDFSSMLETHRGTINHFSQAGNQLIYQTVKNYIEGQHASK